MTSEDRYIRKRLREARRQAREFYYCRKYPIQGNKIVFTTTEGTTGFSCNPKYIALELLRQNLNLDLVWLVDDMTKEFPKGIRKVKNTLKNRAYELSTAKIWIDNSRKQLEVRKRPGQFYLQTWHGMIGAKPTGLDRGASFTRIAYLVSKHDSDMVDMMLSNSKFRDDRLQSGMLYHGKVLKVGSPRCDILINGRATENKKLRKELSLPENMKIMMYAPTFRGGSQETNRSVGAESHLPDFGKILEALENRFGGAWCTLLRLHPQLTARDISVDIASSKIIDASKFDDMYSLLAGCDAFMTDYSSAAFDAAVMKIPVFLYIDDYEDYIIERGKLLVDLRKMPFPMGQNELDMADKIKSFDKETYLRELEDMMKEFGVVENGNASEKVVDEILKHMGRSL